jgi:hypothetical protein
MPTKILVWNIQKFGINKFNNPSMKRGKNIGGLTKQRASAQREVLLDSILQATDPDILVVIEVSSGDKYPESLASRTGGMNGCVAMLARLRGMLGAPDWRLVPPLRLGRGSIAESMGVFYKGQSTNAGVVTNRYFTGPNLWTAGRLSVRPGAAAAAAYAAVGGVDLNAMINPPGGGAARVIPATALHNALLAEDTVAARTEFLLTNADDSAGVGAIDYKQFRSPYMTTFTEVTAGVTRNLSVFGIHSPAVTGDQKVFITHLRMTYEICSALGANETRVIGGDFNLNLLDVMCNDSQVYAPLTAAPFNYDVLLTPAGPPPIWGGDAYPGYFTTHIRPAPPWRKRTRFSRFLWSDGATASTYPGYEYRGSNYAANLYSIDNILVRPAPAAATDVTVMNLVTGTPINAIAAPPGNPPIGTVPGIDFMFNLPAGAVWPQAPLANDYPGVGRSHQLCGWDSYTRIYSISDHFAVYAAV